MSKDNNKSTKTKAPKEQSKAPQAAAPKVSLDPAYIGRITGTLLAICAAVALLLGIVNYITKPIIDEAQAAKNAAAMAQVLQADEYVPLEGELPEHVTALYSAVSGGETIGWAVQTTANGSQGPITMVVGVDTAGAVTMPMLLPASPSSSTARRPTSAPRWSRIRTCWTALWA